MKLKPIVAALVAAAASPAFATIAGGSSGNGELFLSVYDPVAQVSFTKDLGIDQNSFWLSGRATTGSSFASVALSSDANWGAFLGTAGVTPANLQWSVLASETSGGLGTSNPDTGAGQRLFATVQTGTEGGLAAFTNQSLSNGIGTQMGNFLTAVNATGTHATQANGSSVNSVGSYAYFGQPGGTGPDLNGNAMTWLNNSSVGQSAAFYFVGRSGTPQTNFVTATPFSNGQYLGSFVLSNINGYQLDYSLAPVNTVPEPKAALLLLVGLGAVATLGRRRLG